MIVIVSIKDDFHALTVQNRIQNDTKLECCIIDSDNLIDTRGFSWTASVLNKDVACLPARDGKSIDMSDVSLIWWRRYALPQLNFEKDYSNKNAFVTNEWRKAIYGALFTGFRGTWVSDPNCTTVASNKLIQLRRAHKIGWQIPETLVSQDPEKILDFCKAAPRQKVIAKEMGSSRGCTMAAVTLTPTDIMGADTTICPAIYQHFIPGTRHLRINCFGEQVVAFEIETRVIDWRRDHTARMTLYDLDHNTENRVKSLVFDLGLKMGIIDAKLRENGEVCFLEINPQGQYLFLEGATGVDLTGMCAEFLISLVGKE